MRELYYCVLVFVLAIFTSKTYAQTYTDYSNNPAGNDGSTEAKAIHIYTAGDLIYLSQTTADWSTKYFIQMADIDFGTKENVDWDNDGTADWDTDDQYGFSPIGNSSVQFNGLYDGNNKTISNLYINRSASNYIGLFGRTLSSSSPRWQRIRNLILKSCNVTGNSSVGGIAGLNSIEIVNCHIEGIITGNGSNIGGVAGNSGYPISGCSSSATVTGIGRVGGLLGDGSNIDSCYTSGITIGTDDEVGGLVGFLRSPAVNCYASGAVIVDGAYDEAGGLVGKNSGTVTNCYATGVSIPYEFTGGLIGDNYTGTIAESYFDQQTTGQTKKIGLYENNQAGNITILDTDDFKDNSSYFQTWDTDIWSFDSNGRPYLSWQKMAVSNYAASDNTIIGHVIKDAGVVLSETGIRYSSTTEPITWTEEAMATANASISVDLSSVLSIDEEYYVQAYATDDDDNTYYGDMVKVKLCRVTFNANGGTAGTITDEIVTKGEKSTLSGDPTKVGYHINGWNTTANGSGSTITTNTTINASITVYAQWVPNEHYIIFNSNSGSGTMSNQTIAYDATQALSINTFSKTGYSFAGWSETAGGSVVYTDGANYTMSDDQDVTLYAQWTINDYDIIFNSNGGTGTMNNQTLTYNTTEFLTTNTYSKTGYSFAGWSETVNGTVVYSDGANYTMSGDQNVTLYAQWTANEYEIVFDANGGSGTMSNLTIAYDATKALSANTYNKSGYSFAGWSETVNGSVVYTDGADYTMSDDQNVTLYAQWTANEYEIVFDANSGNGTMSNQTIAYDATEVLTTNTFSKTGYSFAGWSETADGTVVYSDGANYTMSDDQDVTLYAQWTINDYDIIFNSNGGTGTMNNQTLTYNTSESLTTNTFSKIGYTFAGWSETADGSVVYTDGANYTMSDDQNVTLYAQWIANEYEIVFDANGGSGTMSNQTMAYDATEALTTNTFSKTGYSFAGWSEIADGTVVYSDGANYTMSDDHNVTLYAQWTANNYEIVFDANGGNGTMSNLTIAYDATKALSTNAYSKTGYSFAGWSETVNGSVVYSDGANYTMSDDHNVTLYAQWTANNYEIVFDANGGNGTMSNLTIAYDATKALSTNAYSKTGYSFAGWSEIADGTVVYTDGADYTMSDNQDVTLYAQWTINDYDVIFNSNGGIGTMNNQTLTYNTTESLTTNTFSKIGYTFAGWSETADGTVVYSDGANYTMSDDQNVTLYAQWTANNYEIVFDSNGGSGTMSNLTIAYDATKALSTNAYSKTGYSFAGWSETVNGSVVYSDGANYTMSDDHNVTLYAQWIANEYEIVFDANGGNGTMSNQTIAYDATEALSTNTFNKTGYSFAGWSETADGSVVYTDGADYTMQSNENVTLYANWNLNTGLENFEINKVSIYPNPVSDILTIELKNDCRIELLDLNGRVIYNENINSNITYLNMRNQTSGIYILRIINEAGIYTRQIVKN